MKKAFTLVELLIVIIIIGILATMAVPQYQKMVNRAKWAEAVQMAGAIRTAEEIYKAQNGAYTPAGANLSGLDVLSLPPLTSRNFSYSIRSANLIYAVHKSHIPNDDYAQENLGDYPYFCVYLPDNSTSYGGGSPDNSTSYGGGSSDVVPGVPGDINF